MVDINTIFGYGFIISWEDMQKYYHNYQDNKPHYANGEPFDSYDFYSNYDSFIYDTDFSYIDSDRFVGILFPENTTCKTLYELEPSYKSLVSNYIDTLWPLMPKNEWPHIEIVVTEITQ